MASRPNWFLAVVNGWFGRKSVSNMWSTRNRKRFGEMAVGKTSKVGNHLRRELCADIGNLVKSAQLAHHEYLYFCCLPEYFNWDDMIVV